MAVRMMMVAGRGMARSSVSASPWLVPGAGRSVEGQVALALCFACFFNGKMKRKRRRKRKRKRKTKRKRRPKPVL